MGGIFTQEKKKTSLANAMLNSFVAWEGGLWMVKIQNDVFAFTFYLACTFLLFQIYNREAETPLLD